MTVGSSTAGRRRRPLTTAVGALAIVAALAFGATIASAQTDRRGETAPASSLAWQSCGRFECADLTVPLDHDQPEIGSLDIAVIRQVAAEPDQRIGALVFNPGGPGASGRSFLSASIESIPSELANRFDLVSYDPRGVGASDGLDCGAIGQEEITTELDPSDEFTDYIDFLQRLGNACREERFEVLAHLGTVDGVHDLDLLRAALGEDQISFVGYSYGTVIGATYGELYPDHVRAMVLDGAIPPDLDLLTDPIRRANAFEAAFGRLDQGCALEPTCPINGTVTDLWDQVRAAVDDESLATDDESGRRLTDIDFGLATLLPLYAPEARESFLFGLNDAANGDGSLLLVLADLFANRQPDGTYPDSAAIMRSVTCIDRHRSLPPDWTARLVAEARDTAPRFAEAVASSPLDCRWWPAKGHPLPDLTGANLPPLLVIGNTFDPATPYDWTKRLAAALPTAALLRADIDGHTAFLANRCTTELGTRYLLDLTVPGPGVHCHEAGFFGIIPAETATGVIVVDVIPNSGAAEAGVLPGDIVVSIDEVPVSRLRDVPAVSENQTVQLEVLRNRRITTLPTTLGVAPYSTPAP